jgi:hypothetical protein
MGLSRTFVELFGDGIEVLFGMDRQVSAFGQVLAEEAVGVFVSAVARRWIFLTPQAIS